MFHRVAHRFFFAIRPPIEIARQFINGAAWFDADGRSLRPEHVHLTLDILDDVDQPAPRIEAALCRAGDQVAASPFRLTFDLAVGSHRSIALRPRLANPGLAALRRAVVAERQRVGLPARAGYGFSPHLTLGYRDGVAFTRPIAPVGWDVGEFVLIHSHVGRTRHETLGCWRLTDAGDGDGPQLSLL